MRRVPLEQFLRAPIGHWTHVPPMVVWMASQRLCGIAYGGFVSSTDLPALRELADLAFHRALARPYRALVDCRGLTGIDAAAFAFLVDYVRQMAGATGALVDRVACVRAPGMTGVASIGLFHEHMNPALAMRFVDTLDEAIAFLDAGADRAAIHEVSELGIGTSLVAALRRLLRDDVRQTLARVARELGVSTRSLQRACTAAGSSFRDEVAAARFAAAEQLVRATDDKLEAIARRVGYASPVSLARRFQRVHGITPSEYRRRGS